MLYYRSKKKIEKDGSKMSRMKTLTLYVLAIVGFFLFSELLINASLESTYKEIGRRDNISQVAISQAEATIVNGRLKGTITNPEDNPINGKYLKVDFYSARDVLMGTKYIDVSNLQVNQTQEIEMYFKLENINYYNISVTDEKTEKEIELLPKDLTKPEIIMGTILTLLIFW